MTFTFEEGNFGAAASVANRRLFRLRYASEESRSKALARSLAKRQYPRGNASGELEQLACLFDWSRRSHYWHGGLHVKACRSWMLPVAYDPELHTVTQATTSEADCSGKAVHAVWLGFSRAGLQYCRNAGRMAASGEKTPGLFRHTARVKVLT